MHRTGMHALLFLSKVSGIVSSNILTVPLMAKRLWCQRYHIRAEHKPMKRRERSAKNRSAYTRTPAPYEPIILKTHDPSGPLLTAKGGAKELWKGGVPGILFMDQPSHIQNRLPSRWIDHSWFLAVATAQNPLAPLWNCSIGQHQWVIFRRPCWSWAR